MEICRAFSFLRSINFRSGTGMISIQEFIRKFYLTIIFVIVISVYPSSILVHVFDVRVLCYLLRKLPMLKLLLLMSNIHLFAKKAPRLFYELSLISNSIVFMNNVSF